MSSFPGMTAILATSYCSPKMLALSVLSLIANSSIRSIIVNINGSWEDRKYGDIKQDWLFRLRERLSLHLRVMRVWGHVGHAESIDGAISWCETENMLLMHDDTIVLNNTWESYVPKELEKPDVGAVAHRGYCLDHVCKSSWRGLPHYALPHMGACFLFARKSRLIGWRWQGWHVALPDRAVGYDMGVWLLHQMVQNGLTMVRIDGHVYHVSGLSSPRGINQKQIDGLMEAEQLALNTFTPELRDIYDEFKDSELLGAHTNTY